MTPSPVLQQFLDLIAWSEGTSLSPITKNNGYDVIVTGITGPAIFTDYSDHPFAKVGKVQWRSDPPQYSTAAGRYQLLARYWNIYRMQLDLSNFSPTSQDAVALQQMKERRATEKILDGDIAGAVSSCSNIWASFPGNQYGQNSHSIDKILIQYNKLSKEN